MVIQAQTLGVDLVKMKSEDLQYLVGLSANRSETVELLKQWLLKEQGGPNKVDVSSPKPLGWEASAADRVQKEAPNNDNNQGPNDAPNCSGNQEETLEDTEFREDEECTKETGEPGETKPDLEQARVGRERRFKSLLRALPGIFTNAPYYPSLSLFDPGSLPPSSTAEERMQRVAARSLIRLDNLGVGHWSLLFATLKALELVQRRTDLPPIGLAELHGGYLESAREQGWFLASKLSLPQVIDVLGDTVTKITRNKWARPFRLGVFRNQLFSFARYLGDWKRHNLEDEWNSVWVQQGDGKLKGE